MNWLKILVLLAAAVLFAVLLTGCVSVTRVQSTRGKAFVEHGTVFGTNMYNCDASDGKPECWPVKENELEGGDQ